MLVFFNRLLGMEKWCFSSSIRPERVYWNIIIKTLMQGLYLVTMLWILMRRHLCLFLLCFPGWEGGVHNHAFFSMAPFCKQLKAVRDILSSKAQSLTKWPTCCVEQGRHRVVLTFCWCWSPALSALALKRENLPKPHCSLAARGLIWWILTLCSQRHHQMPRISFPLAGTQGKAWLRYSWALWSRWTSVLTFCRPPMWLRSNSLFLWLHWEWERQQGLGLLWADWEIHFGEMGHEQWASSLHSILRSGVAGQRQRP